MIEMTWSVERDETGRPVLKSTWGSRVDGSQQAAYPLAS